MRARIGICLITVVVTCIGCEQPTEPTVEPAEQAEPRAKPLVFTTNYPLHFFAESIAGDVFDVVLPVPVDVDPAFWNPTIDDILRMQDAELILLNGAGYESWLNKVALDVSRVVDTSLPFGDDLIESSSTTHSHGLEGEHSHGEYAFTTWLDLKLAERQMQTVGQALSQAKPDHADEFAANMEALSNAILRLDDEMRLAAERLGGRPILYSHPVYQYLQRAYGLNGVAVHWEPGIIPRDEAWHRLDVLLRTHPATIMLWEDKPITETVTALAERNVRSIVFNPSAKRPATGDFLNAMEENVARLATLD